MVLTRKIEGGWKKHLPKVTLVSYIVLSALFIVWTVFSMLKVGVYQAGYNRALFDISAQSLVQGSCQTGISLPTADGKTATLINVVCLPPAQESQAAPENTAQ